MQLSKSYIFQFELKNLSQHASVYFIIKKKKKKKKKKKTKKKKKKKHTCKYQLSKIKLRPIIQSIEISLEKLQSWPLKLVQSLVNQLKMCMLAINCMYNC